MGAQWAKQRCINNNNNKIKRIKIISIITLPLYLKNIQSHIWKALVPQWVGPRWDTGVPSAQMGHQCPVCPDGTPVSHLRPDGTLVSYVAPGGAWAQMGPQNLVFLMFGSISYEKYRS